MSEHEALIAHRDALRAQVDAARARVSADDREAHQQLAAAEAKVRELVIELSELEQRVDLIEEKTERLQMDLAAAREHLRQLERGRR